MTLRPTSDLVAVAWLRGVPGVPSGQVGTTLPTDNSTWAASGFVQVTTVGGDPEIYYALAQPVVQVDCWAVNPNSQKPPWNKANALAEAIRYGCLADDVKRKLTLPAGYAPARVQSAYVVTEPRRIHEDAANYARYTFDLQMHWITLEE